MVRTVELEDTALSSERLSLKAFTPMDAAEIAAPITPAIIRFLNWDALRSREGWGSVWRDWIEKMRTRTGLALVIRHRANGALVGVTGLHFVDRAEPTAGIWIRDAVQSQGYGSESMRAVTKWAFGPLHARSIYFPVFDGNVRGRRIAEGLGGYPVDDDPRQRAPAFAGPMVLYKIPRPHNRTENLSHAGTSAD